jgi:tetratricopeptide (TPR) repeat protein
MSNSGNILLIRPITSQAAEEDFSAAIRLQPDCGEAWKRRGQTRAALGLDTEAIRDLTQALDAGGGNCAELYNERG